jgi:hypothetical protein
MALLLFVQMVRVEPPMGDTPNESHAPLTQKVRKEGSWEQFAFWKKAVIEPAPGGLGKMGVQVRVYQKSPRSLCVHVGGGRFEQSSTLFDVYETKLVQLESE